VERHLEHQDRLQYNAALAPWATFNVNRKEGAAFMSPLDFMVPRSELWRERKNEPPTTPTQQGRPAVLLAPVPKTGVRYAVKGERPASRFAPGQNDGVIERYDAYITARTSGKAN
jgi:hypothetical protein